MSNYTISIPKQSDLDSFTAMLRQSWLDTYPNEQAGVSAEFIDKHTSRMLTDEGRAFQAKLFQDAHTDPEYYLRVAKNNDGELVGFVEAYRGEKNDLRGIYIAKSEYGTGLAMELALPALQWIGEDKEITVTVASYNKRAIAFYEKLGFKTIDGSERLHKNTPITVVDMKKEAVA